jgi:hypothetical protein
VRLQVLQIIGRREMARGQCYGHADQFWSIAEFRDRSFLKIYNIDPM